MTAPSIVETVGARRIMEDLLWDRKIKGGLTNCVNPAHDDEHPSMSIDPVKGVFNCFACGVQGGALDFAVLRGVGRTPAEAAAELALKYGQATNGNHPKPQLPVEWPYFPKTAESLGWTLDPSGFGDAPALRVPTWNADGSPARTKLRGPRQDGKLLVRFENDAADCGIINLPALIDHSAGTENPRCLLVAGETDLLAWTWACKNEGIDVPAVSLSTGESSILSGDALLPFRGVEVYVAYDRDDVGKKGGETNARALGPTARYVPPPSPYKDLRDYISSGGTARDYLRLCETPEEPKSTPFTPISALDLIAKPLPEIEEIVSPRVIYRGGVTVLVASHKRGKSLAALGLCVDLVLMIAAPEYRPAEALPRWLGQTIVGRGPVLVYSAEGGERMVQERLRKMCPSPTEELRNLFIYAQTPAPQLDQDAQIDAVFAHAERVGAILIVFDPLGRFWAMEDEADPTAARNLILAIQTRAEAAYTGRGIAVLVIHHDTKSMGSDESSAVTGGRGSGKFGDDADALINLKIASGDETGQSVAKFLLRHAESPTPVPVQIDRKTLRLVERKEKSERSGASKTGRPPLLSVGALENLIRAKGRIAAFRVADELQVSASTWKNNRRDMVTDLVEAGLIAVETAPGTNRQEYVWTGTYDDGTETNVGSPWAPATETPERP